MSDKNEVKKEDITSDSVSKFLERFLLGAADGYKINCTYEQYEQYEHNMSDETKLKCLINTFQVARIIKYTSEKSYEEVYKKAYDIVNKYIAVDSNKQRKLIAMRASCLKVIMSLCQKNNYQNITKNLSIYNEVESLIEEINNNTLTSHTKYYGFALVKLHLFRMYLQKVHLKIMILANVK